ncbi:hypothetical protein C1J03_20465 [Sulfitobacter sp. SK012]|uniref:hypothetical protein n=1 Tax=Sulfitobacter sp. SK012 TaxID=1389005 RepID=UPI000E0BE41C|nr:hypothetical protein [Sulfitobacter sp. SK012]AXI48164.1 hypothetical protein C1J03_20465 [Sulfitobacter sp. SK012]
MKRFLTKFRADTSGAVTVDWVVLCAAVVGLAVAAISSIQTGTSDLGDSIWAYTTSLDFF